MNDKELSTQWNAIYIPVSDGQMEWHLIDIEWASINNVKKLLKFLIN